VKLDPNWWSAVAATVSAIADIATAGTAILATIWIVNDRHKRRPDLIAAWGQLYATDEPDVMRLTLFAVSLLPEPVTLTDVWGLDGLQLEGETPRTSQYATTFYLPDPANPGARPPPPKRDWVPHKAFSQLLPGHRRDGDYTAIFSVRVCLAQLRGSPMVKVRARLASDPRETIEKTISLAWATPRS